MVNVQSRVCLGLLGTTVWLGLAGCGPQFFSAKGSIASDGGPLDHWTAKPAMCTRDEFDRDSSKLLTFLFANPANNDPDRSLHREQQPNSPASLTLARNGDGVIARLDMMKPVKAAPGDMTGMMHSMDGYTLDSSSCKTLSLTRTEQAGSFGSLHKPIKGELRLDCTVSGSHLSGDIIFQHCGM